MTHRIFVGKVSDRTTDSSLRQAFEEFGEVKSVEIKGNYAFVYFDQADHAQSAIEKMHGRELDGSTLVVENARSSSSNHNNADRSTNRGGPRLVRRLDLRILIRDVQRSVSWQDLKDWARNAGDVTYANVFVDHNNDYLGLIEYKDEATLEKALRIMEDIPLKGNRVRVEKDDPDADHHNIPPNRGTLDFRGRPGNAGGHGRGGGDRDAGRRDGGYGNVFERNRNGGGSGGAYPPPRDRSSRDRERVRDRESSRNRGGYGQPAFGGASYGGDRAGYDDRARGNYVDYRDEPRGPPHRERERSRSRSPHGGRYSAWEGGGDGRGPSDYGRSSWHGSGGYQEDRRGRSPVGRYYDDRGYDRR